MTYNELIRHYGSQAKAARALGLSPPSVWAWKGGEIPDLRQIEIQKRTGGKLKANPAIVAKYRDLLKAA